jgi:SAM-dependent methyltransferase
MSYLAADVAFFCESFTPDVPSGFDPELDTAVTERALSLGTMQGYCNVAERPATFAVTDANVRENVVADVSGSANRHRILTAGISLALFGTPLVGLPTSVNVMNARRDRVFLTETTTAFHHALKALIADDIFTTSEFFGPQYRSGDLVDGVRHEDLQQTSFPDGHFDLVVTSDVMEHVPDALVAEREIVRILKPGAAYVFTAPLHAMADRDLMLAQLQPDGRIEHFAEPIYHGDPLRAEGALVFRIFSVREMTARFAELGATCTTFRLWSKGYGIIGPGCFIHIVRRDAS